MSQHLICDIIFNYENEWTIDDIIDVANRDFKRKITSEQVQQAIEFLTERGCIDAND
jgi:hypothetical protein